MPWFIQKYLYYVERKTQDWLSIQIYLYYVERKTQDWLSKFKCQNSLRRISYPTKESLKIANVTQYTNHQINNAFKNHIFLKKSRYIYLE